MERLSLKILFLLVSYLVTNCVNLINAQFSTYLHSFDPAEDQLYRNDFAKNIWTIDNLIYINNGFVNDQGRRTNEIIVLDANSKEIVNRKEIIGPDNDLYISQQGGYFITEGNEIIIVGEWIDYDLLRTKTFLGKLDENLNIIWIQFYSDLSEFDTYAYAVTETVDGNIMLSLSEHVSEDPFLVDLKIVKTDSLGNVLWNKIVPDTFKTVASVGDLTSTSDGYYILTTLTVDFIHHPWKSYNTMVFKLTSDGDVYKERLMKFARNPGQAGVNTTLPGGDVIVAYRGDTSWYDWITVDDEFPAMYRLDQNLKEKWRYKWYEPAVHFIYRVVTAANGDILGLGIFQKGISDAKTWLFRASPTGDLLWERHYSDSLQRPWSPQLEMLDLCEMDDGRIAATGIVFDTNVLGDINLNIGLLVTDSAGCIEPNCVGRDQYVTSTKDLSIGHSFILPPLLCSPNPAGNEFWVTFPEDESYYKKQSEIRIYNQQGLLMIRLPIESGIEKLKISSSNWVNGIYRVLLYDHNRPVAGNHIFIIQ